ncbi:hypothetical protein Lser_V15G07200 [Lactuca serriola]
MAPVIGDETDTETSSLRRSDFPKFLSLSNYENPMRVGFLGLGIMGSPMAHNLIKDSCDGLLPDFMTVNRWMKWLKQGIRKTIPPKVLSRFVDVVSLCTQVFIKEKGMLSLFWYHWCSLHKQLFLSK